MKILYYCLFFYSSISYNIFYLFKEKIEKKLNSYGFFMGVKFLSLDSKTTEDPIKKAFINKTNQLKKSSEDSKKNLSEEKKKLILLMIKNKFLFRFNSLSHKDKNKVEVVFDNIVLNQIKNELNQEIKNELNQEIKNNIIDELYKNLIKEIFIIYKYIMNNELNTVEENIYYFNKRLCSEEYRSEFIKNQDNLPIITYRDGPYKHPFRRLYGSLEIDKEIFIKNIKFLGNKIPINFLLSLTLALDPLVWRKNSGIMMILLGLQMPEMLTILPSNTSLYMKLFLSNGFLLIDKKFYWMTGINFMMGYKGLGYIKLELLNNLNTTLYFLFNIFSYILGIFQIFKDIINATSYNDGFFQWFKDFSKNFLKIFKNKFNKKSTYDNYIINNYSVIAISIISKNTATKSYLAQYLEKKVTKSIDFYLDSQKNQKLKQKKLLKQSHRNQLI